MLRPWGVPMMGWASEDLCHIGQAWHGVTFSPYVSVSCTAPVKRLCLHPSSPYVVRYHDSFPFFNLYFGSRKNTLGLVIRNPPNAAQTWLGAIRHSLILFLFLRLLTATGHVAKYCLLVILLLAPCTRIFASCNNCDDQIPGMIGAFLPCDNRVFGVNVTWAILLLQYQSDQLQKNLSWILLSAAVTGHWPETPTHSRQLFFPSPSPSEAWPCDFLCSSCLFSETHCS